MAELPSDNTNENESNNRNENESDNKNDDNISCNTSDNTSDNINDNTNDTKKASCDAREAVRRQFYKNHIKGDYFKLDIDEITPQEERRRLLLEYQKKFRAETIDAARGMHLKQYSISENEEHMDEEYIEEEYMEDEYMDDECEQGECMECEEQNAKKYWKKHMEHREANHICNKKDLNYMKVEGYASWHYRIIPNQSKTYRMMLSEWMLDAPQDFTEKWIMVPCPIGHRVRLISGWGETKAYSRAGIIHAVFPSALPGGNPSSNMHHSAAIDGIWSELRLFWLKTKFMETPELKKRTDINKYPILSIPNIDCNLDLSSALENLDSKLYPLDGFLFYHREAIYTYGCTPLVTWLKPFMLSEVLGISAPSLFNEKPDDYIDFQHHLQKIEAKKCNKTTTAMNSMEIEGVA
ncbi:snurportin-1 isoform X2 [Solenopsis invicta]|uniref:snurportin-1 isoform X2 n=1 Tax=Solenopsis invicta TaxID=13686 RepID=UPI00193D31D5|nr:snurportin-1 isoform X2 [Solenopsis invicta]